MVKALQAAVLKGLDEVQPVVVLCGIDIRHVDRRVVAPDHVVLPRKPVVHRLKQVLAVVGFNLPRLLGGQLKDVEPQNPVILDLQLRRHIAPVTQVLLAVLFAAVVAGAHLDVSRITAPLP